MATWTIDKSADRLTRQATDEEGRIIGKVVQLGVGNYRAFAYDPSEKGKNKMRDIGGRQLYRDAKQLVMATNAIRVAWEREEAKRGKLSDAEKAVIAQEAMYDFVRGM